MYIYVNEFHKNDSATRILAPILTDLVLLHKTCGIWNSSLSGFAWAGTQLYKQEYICIEQQETVKKYAK